ncbi:hypothetical protein [Burkholderia sp. HI2500]|uniref:hypothetical protein n=1 Tax=Burkholderia sp. HI2500 TaxID=2015358 RepID=UPI000B79E1D7|nr:hypothetical protein [Burkholderia sp. HI2500]OXJ06673.1 hypothetical protein CFB45_37655 [Burkholderia sp. HI2500]
MSKTLSYTQLTAYAEQDMRKHLADAAAYLAAGDVDSARFERAAASGVYGMWTTLVVEHLDGYHRKSFMADFTRLEALMNPASVPAADAT